MDTEVPKKKNSVQTKLLRYKKKNDLTLNEMAKKLGIKGKAPRTVVFNWVKGRSLPTLRYSKKIETVFGIKL